MPLCPLTRGASCILSAGPVLRWKTLGRLWSFLSLSAQPGETQQPPFFSKGLCGGSIHPLQPFKRRTRSALCTISGLALGWACCSRLPRPVPTANPSPRSPSPAKWPTVPPTRSPPGLTASASLRRHQQLRQISFASRVSGLFGINDRGSISRTCSTAAATSRSLGPVPRFPGSPDLNIFFGADAIPNIGDSGRIVFLSAVGGAAGVTTTNDAAVFATQDVLSSQRARMIGREDAGRRASRTCAYGAANVLNPAYFCPRRPTRAAPRARHAARLARHDPQRRLSWVPPRLRRAPKCERAARRPSSTTSTSARCSRTRSTIPDAWRSA